MKMNWHVPYTWRRGFSLVEVSVATLLSSLLLLMVSSVWFSFGRATRGNVADADLAAEARLTAEAFRRDFSGYRPDAAPGDKQLGRLVGRTIVGGERLLLCYDGAPINKSADWADPDRVVEYGVVEGQLQRIDSDTGATVVVADNVAGLAITDLGTGVRIELTLEQTDVQQTYTWITQDP
jgi:prepilin-type N-terminal cleavage/methylation domain-containing protein